MVVKCSRDSAIEKSSCSYEDGRREIFDSVHKNYVINLDFVVSFRKEEYEKPNISFAFNNYVFGELSHRWVYEDKDERDADFEKLLKLVAHQL